jgi:hypothetical protein
MAGVQTDSIIATCASRTSAQGTATMWLGVASHKSYSRFHRN